MKFGPLVGLVAALVASLSGAAAAQPPGDEADRYSIYKASLVVPPIASADLEWKGLGSTKGGMMLCVSSTSGRYALDVSSMTGTGLVGITQVAYTVRFESEGTTQTARISPESPSVRFHGAVAPDRDCARGPNARIVVSLENPDALAATSGAYSDQVALLIEPR